MFIEALGIDSEKIDESFLQSLVDSKQPEQKKLDYKEKLPFSYKVVGKKITIDFADEAKKEFLRDVSSFANASGGVLLYSISDAGGGIPDALVGLDIEDQHEERILQTIGSVIRAGIAPRIPGILPLFILVLSSKKVYILAIPKSWIGPHQITFNGDGTFWARNNERGKYQMDINEIRAAILRSETLTERIRKFRDERTLKVFAYEPRLNLESNAKTVIQLIPIDAFDPDTRYDNIDVLFRDNEALKPMFRYKSGHPYLGFNNVIERMYNTEGIKKYSNFQCYDVDGRPYREPYTCVQLFKNGIIEAVEQRELNSIKDTKVIFDEYFQGLIDSLSNYLEALKILGVTVPVYFFLTLLGVKGYRLSRGFQVFDQKIARDILAIPENITEKSIIEKLDDKPEHILRPYFDTIWNACGYPACSNYDEDDNWTVKGSDERIKKFI